MWVNSFPLETLPKCADDPGLTGGDLEFYCEMAVLEVSPVPVFPAGLSKHCHMYKVNLCFLIA